MPHRAFSQKLNHLINFSFIEPENPSAPAIDDQEIFDQLEGEKSSLLFMGKYTLPQIETALERFGILPRIRDLGYKNIEVDFKPRNVFEHRLTIRTRDQGASDDLLGEIVVKEGRFNPDVHYFPERPLGEMNLIFIEWMLLQQPGVSFDTQCRKMPGQNWPGLGIGRAAMDLLHWVSTHTGKDGIMNFPEFYHNGLFYSEKFFFYNPKKQAELLAINRDLTAMGWPIGDISFAAYFDCILDLVNHKPYRWTAQEQICPVSNKLSEYFAHPNYAGQVHAHLKNLSFGLDEKRYQSKIPERETIRW